MNSDDRLARYNRTRVLVTGGAGFVGSSLATRLVGLGAEVTVLDDLTTGLEELVPRGVKAFVHGSVEDPETLDPLVAGSDYVFHLAARVLASSTKDIRSDYRVNIGGTLNILLAARDLGPKAPPVVYTSTTSVYGNPRALPITEDEPTNILSPYAASKFAAESYCRAFVEMYELPIVMVRYSNVYGPHQSPRNPYCGVVSKFLEAGLEGRPMCIHGTGLQTRDFTYIDDAVTATLLAALVPRALGEVFNVGSGVETNVRQLAGLIAGLMPGQPPVEFIDRRDIDNVSRRVVNIEKARRTLRWVPETSLERGLAATLQWLESSKRAGQRATASQA
ncbi:MAG: NAD-dependent epimerase/dehydratase family protein [Verrucomicrobiales bacterium]|nr:NAD-dependent epimerase/dehydratase family protein [Planctomycetota bacterium]MCP5523493.1 NAD-dependent epimerase/dehydratase family protein [Verrucomicrobiales bacterium]